jgi:hypothetical protein
VLLACALVIPALAIPRAAGADGAGVIAVSTTDRANVAAAVGQAMTGRAGRIVSDAVAEARAAITAGAVPTETLQAFRKVRDQVDEGWRAYQRDAVEAAASRLVAARTAAEPLVGLAGGAELYADAALRLGIVLGHLGRTSEAQAVLSLALALDPDRPVTKAEFAPDVVDAVEAARAAPVALEQVHITSVPAGAAIQVDGKSVGRAPLNVQVTRGQHLIVARTPRYLPTVQALAADSPAVEVVLDRDDAAIRIAGGAEPGLGEREAQELVDATLRYADLDEVVLVADATRRGGPTLLVQRCAGLPARCSAVVELGYGDRTGLATAARAAWDAAKTGDLRYPPTVLSERAGKALDGHCKVCRSPWLWTGVGAAVVVGTIVTIAVLSGSQPPPVVGVNGGDFHQ